jgi:hypothetical protein
MEIVKARKFIYIAVALLFILVLLISLSQDNSQLTITSMFSIFTGVVMRLEGNLSEPTHAIRT